MLESRQRTTIRTDRGPAWPTQRITEMIFLSQSSKKHLMSLIRLVDITVIYEIFTLEDTVKLDGYQLIPFL